MVFWIGMMLSMEKTYVFLCHGWLVYVSTAVKTAGGGLGYPPGSRGVALWGSAGDGDGF